MKERLDVILVNQGYYSSREKAKRAIMAGLVYVNKTICDKAGTMIKEDAEIEVKGSSCPFVGRGGLKLAKAIEVFDIDLNGKICMDIGASTGGFTDCMLQNGAKKVYAVDVGYGQLNYKLRTDSRVINMEKSNFRYFTKDTIKDELDFASCDVSFISLRLMLRPMAQLLKGDGRAVCLIKPQFEAGRSQVGKNGIVRDSKVHLEVVESVIGYATSQGLYPLGLDFSPIKGAKGNIEYLLYLCKNSNLSYNMSEIREVVIGSHRELE